MKKGKYYNISDRSSILENFKIAASFVIWYILYLCIWHILNKY